MTKPKQYKRYSSEFKKMAILRAARTILYDLVLQRNTILGLPTQRQPRRIDDGTRPAEVVDEHPVTQGLPAGFPVVDELYLGQVFEDEVTPLIRSSHEFSRDNFYSAAKAISGTLYSREGWDHPPGSNCVAWTKQVHAAQLVYLQFGDCPQTYANPHVRQVLANALNFIAGD